VTFVGKLWGLFFAVAMALFGIALFRDWGHVASKLESAYDRSLIGRRLFGRAWPDPLRLVGIAALLVGIALAVVLVFAWMKGW